MLRHGNHGREFPPWADRKLLTSYPTEGRVANVGGREPLGKRGRLTAATTLPCCALHAGQSSTPQCQQPPAFNVQQPSTVHHRLGAFVGTSGASTSTTCPVRPPDHISRSSSGSSSESNSPSSESRAYRMWPSFCFPEPAPTPPAAGGRYCRKSLAALSPAPRCSYGSTTCSLATRSCSVSVSFMPPSIRTIRSWARLFGSWVPAVGAGIADTGAGPGAGFFSITVRSPPCEITNTPSSTCQHPVRFTVSPRMCPCMPGEPPGPCATRTRRRAAARPSTRTLSCSAWRSSCHAARQHDTCAQDWRSASSAATWGPPWVATNALRSSMATQAAGPSASSAALSCDRSARAGVCAFAPPLLAVRTSAFQPHGSEKQSRVVSGQLVLPASAA
mmetsp:Transcript_41277/g.106878  ORF Transcript_41277/g.106878 Transcript_41277/m.106878 type:complete len:389 (+) Transcript_41277:1045-2211(+)